MQKQVHTIYYKFKNPKRKTVYNVTTKPCTYAQALDAFNTETNSLNTFVLVNIIPQQ